MRLTGINVFVVVNKNTPHTIFFHPFLSSELERRRHSAALELTTVKTKKQAEELKNQLEEHKTKKNSLVRECGEIQLEVAESSRQLEQLKCQRETIAADCSNAKRETEEIKGQLDATKQLEISLMRDLQHANQTLGEFGEEIERTNAECEKRLKELEGE